jgi:hypothetical protein
MTTVFTESFKNSCKNVYKDFNYEDMLDMFARLGVPCGLFCQNFGDLGGLNYDGTLAQVTLWHFASRLYNTNVYASNMKLAKMTITKNFITDMVFYIYGYNLDIEV